MYFPLKQRKAKWNKNNSQAKIDMNFQIGKEKQTIQDIVNSNVNQAGRDININVGVQYSDLRQMVLDVVRAEMFQSNQVFRQTLEARALEYEAKVVGKISDEQDVALIDKFARPDIQFAMRDSVKQFVRSGSQEDLEEQVDMLIDRLKVGEDSVMQSVIEEAINILPRLSKPAVALLASMRLRTMTMNGNCFSLLTALRVTGAICKELDGLKPIDISYLRQRNCCIPTSGYKKYNSYEEILVKKYDMFFRHYGESSNYEKIMSEHPELNIKINNLAFFIPYNSKYIIPSLHRLSMLENELKCLGVTDRYDLISAYVNSCPKFNEQEVWDFVINESPDWKFGFEVLDRDDVRELEITPLGAYIGQKFLKKLTKGNYPDIDESFNKK